MGEGAGLLRPLWVLQEVALPLGVVFPWGLWAHAGVPVSLSVCPPAGLCSKNHFQRRFVQPELPTETPPPCFPFPKPTQTDPQTHTQGSAREEGAAEMKGWAGCKAGLALCRALPAGPETLQPNPPLCSGSLETTPLGLSGGNTPRSSPCSPAPQESPAPLGLALEGCAYLPSVPVSKLWTLPMTSAVPHTHSGNPRRQRGLGKGRHGACPWLLLGFHEGGSMYLTGKTFVFLQLDFTRR